MNKNLSRIVADLFVKSKGGEDLSSKIDRLRGEIKKGIDSDDAIFGKFRGLLDSFGEVIPDEKQRYHAAIKALSTTSKLNQREIVKAVARQLEELRTLEKGLMPAIPVWREDLKVMEAKSREINAEIAKLRDKIARLESDDAGVLKGMAARENELDLIEKSLKGLFADIGAEIGTIRDKLEEFTAEGAPAQPRPAAAQPIAKKVPEQTIPVDIDLPGEGTDAIERTIGTQEPSEPLDTEFQKKCPMCGGRMNFHAADNLWMCYTCAYEESDTGGQGKSAASREKSSAPEPAPASEPVSDQSSSFIEPLADMTTSDFEGSKKRSSLSDEQPQKKTKPCPACRKKMYWYPEQNAWRCPSCQYETRHLK